MATNPNVDLSLTEQFLRCAPTSGTGAHAQLSSASPLYCREQQGHVTEPVMRAKIRPNGAFDAPRHRALGLGSPAVGASCPSPTYDHSLRKSTSSPSGTSRPICTRLDDTWGTRKGGGD